MAFLYSPHPETRLQWQSAQKSLPNIAMDPVRDADDLLSADMGVFCGIAYGKEAGELIAFRRMHKPFRMFCLVSYGDAEGAGKTFGCGCRRMFSTAAQAEAK